MKVYFDTEMDTLKALDKVKLSGSVSGMRDGFVGISCVVDDLLQPVFDRPESGGSHVASHSAHIICR